MRTRVVALGLAGWLALLAVWLVLLALRCSGSAGQPSAGTPAPSADATPDNSNAVCQGAFTGPQLTPVVGRDFALMDQSMAKVIAQAEAGHPGGAGVTFMDEVHTFTHLIDPALRQRDQELATTLYDAVADIELGIAQRVDAESFAALARTARDLLSQAAVPLGCGP